MIEALRIRDHDEVGAPEPVQIDGRIAQRLKDLRIQWRGDTEYQAKSDPKTGQVYLLATGRVAAPSPPKVERSAPRTQAAPPVVDNPVEKVDKPSRRVKKPLALEW